MAIQKSKTLVNGASGNYWKITLESYDKVSMECVAIISLFLDHDHSMSGAGLGMDKVYKFSATREELQGNRTLLAYAKIKAKAASMMTPIGGPIDADPVAFDSDLVGGTDV